MRDDDSTEPWRAFDAAWYRAAYPEVEQWLAAGRFASPEDVYAKLGRALGHDPNPFFSELWYLARYPDVRQAVARGGFTSGFDHYCKHGSPDFAPHWLFDPHTYRAQFELRAGRPFDPVRDGDPYTHLLLTGQHVGLSGHPFFDPSVYQAFAPYDIRARIRKDGPFTTYLLHIRSGAPEPNPSALFDATWYRARYPDVGIGGNVWLCALHHYLTNDEPTRFDPSPRFSETGYLALHVDIRMAVSRAECRNGYDHFLRHGQREGRFFCPASPESRSALPEIRDDPGDTTRFALRARRFETVTLLPIERDYTFGVYDREGRSLAAFRHPWLRDRPPAEVLPVTAGEAIYGGLLMSHFGHVLRDSLARLWFLRQRPDLMVLWHWIDLPVPHNAWPGWMEELFRMLGLQGHRWQIIRAPMTIERLILPDSGLPAPNTLHPLQAKALACQPPLGPHRGRRIWLSRHALPDRFGRMLGEDVLEDRLRHLGWTILCPESLPVNAQVDLFAVEAIVAGFIGSAFHAVVLAQAATASLILVMRPLIDRTFYDAVARTRGLKQVYIDPPLRPIEKLEFWGSYELADARTLADRVQAQADLLS